MSRAGITTLAEIASSQWGMVTAAQAARAGVSSQAIYRLTNAGELERLTHGVYRMAGSPPHPHDELRAAWLALDPRSDTDRRFSSGHVELVSHRSAAFVHDVGDVDADILEFTVRQRRQTRRTDMRLHRASVTPADWSLVDGLPVTTVPRTIHDLAAARLDRGHLAGVVRDAMLRFAVSVASVAATLAPYARRYGMTAGDGEGLVVHLLDEAGIPDAVIEVAEAARQLSSGSLTDNDLGREA